MMNYHIQKNIRTLINQSINYLKWNLIEKSVDNLACTSVSDFDLIFNEMHYRIRRTSVVGIYAYEFMYKNINSDTINSEFSSIRTAHEFKLLNKLHDSAMASCLDVEFKDPFYAFKNSTECSEEDFNNMLVVE